MENVQASIYFLAHKELYRTEQPYSLRYTGEERIPSTNIELDRHDISIRDIRGREHEFSLEANGFMISRFNSRMRYQDFNDRDQIISIYLHEVASHLKSLLGARHVQVFEHLVGPLRASSRTVLRSPQVRKRHPHFPVSTGEQYAYDQPTSTAHIGMLQRITL